MTTGAFETRTVFDRYLQSLGPAAPVKDLAALLAGGQFHPAITGQLREAVASAGMISPAYAAIFVRRDRLRVAVLGAMARQRLDAVLYPHQRRPVATIGFEQQERNGVLSNATGFPALTVPAGFTASSVSAPLGVPVGMELLGREWSEGTLIRLGYAFEQATSPRRLPASTPPLTERQTGRQSRESGAAVTRTRRPRRSGTARGRSDSARRGVSAREPVRHVVPRHDRAHVGSGARVGRGRVGAVGRMLLRVLLVRQLAVAWRVRSESLPAGTRIALWLGVVGAAQRPEAVALDVVRLSAVRRPGRQSDVAALRDQERGRGGSLSAPSRARAAAGRMLEAVLAVKGRTAFEIFGSPDDMKLRSCATLFAHVSPPGRCSSGCSNATSLRGPTIGHSACWPAREWDSRATDAQSRSASLQPGRYTYPHTIENGAGERITFLRRVPGATGDRVEGENLAMPGAGPPMHIHHYQVESFTVQRGRIGYQRLGRAGAVRGAGRDRYLRSRGGPPVLEPRTRRPGLHRLHRAGRQRRVFPRRDLRLDQAARRHVTRSVRCRLPGHPLSRRVHDGARFRRSCGASCFRCWSPSAPCSASIAGTPMPRRRCAARRQRSSM